MFNGVELFSKMAFQARQEFLKEVYGFYTACPVFETLPVLLRSGLTTFKGKEYYTAEPGAKGIYVEESIDPLLEIVRTEIPDVYLIPSNKEYLEVKSLAVSKYLASLGATFSLPCRNNMDGTWTPIVSSSSLTNETPYT
jgi:hypothetical protein